MATTPIFLPGEPHEQRSLAGYSPWSCKELNRIRLKQLSMHTAHFFLASNLGRVHSKHIVANQGCMSSIKESESHLVVRDSATPRTIQSMEFATSEYWSGQPFPSPGYLPNPGMESMSPVLQADSLPAESQGKFCANNVLRVLKMINLQMGKDKQCM